MTNLQHGRYAATFFPGGNFVGQDEYEDILQRGEPDARPSSKRLWARMFCSPSLQALISGSASVSDAEIHDAIRQAEHQGEVRLRRP